MSIIDQVVGEFERSSERFAAAYRELCKQLLDAGESMAKHPGNCYACTKQADRLARCHFESPYKDCLWPECPHHDEAMFMKPKGGGA